MLLVHVVGSTSPSALLHSTPFAMHLVQYFLKEHTKIDIGKVSELSDKFRNLEDDSRLEILFKGKPKGFAAPSHAVFTHNSEYGFVVFEVETRITGRYIPPGAKYQELEIERADFLIIISIIQIFEASYGRAKFRTIHKQSAEHWEGCRSNLCSITTNNYATMMEPRIQEMQAEIERLKVEITGTCRALPVHSAMKDVTLVQESKTGQATVKAAVYLNSLPKLIHMQRLATGLRRRKR